MIKVTLVDKMGTDLTVVNSARVSFGKSTSSLTDKDIRLIKYLADNQHLTPFEHCQLSVLIECPLYIRSQILRHRSFSANEVSRRYTSENLEYYVPPTDDIRVQAAVNRQASGAPLTEDQAAAAHILIEQAHQYADSCYAQLLKMGVSREQARGVLPQNLMTKFYFTGNLRNWVHFVKLRIEAHAQKEAQYVAQQVKDILLAEFPIAAEALLSST